MFRMQRSTSEQTMFTAASGQPRSVSAQDQNGGAGNGELTDDDLERVAGGLARMWDLPASTFADGAPS